MDNSDEFSDELDEFEESQDDTNIKKKTGTTIANKPYDEAYDISQDLSMVESYDARDKGEKKRVEMQMKNDKYDEACDVSQSMDQSNIAVGKEHRSPHRNESVKSAPDRRDSENSMSFGVLNKPFDEALEFSQSGSEKSVETKGSEKRRQSGSSGEALTPTNASEAKPLGMSPSASALPYQKPIGAPLLSNLPAKTAPLASQQKTAKSRESKADGDEDSSSEDGDPEESYENIAGAYNPKDYVALSVSAEVRDLFQYIERYKPQEVELESTLKCFIPDYIPAIGEMDAFIKVPRPDKKEEDLGLKFLDEPSSSQSDPTVLELQLRAMSKKLQYGDVVVRSIENAAKNPVAIDKWIQSVGDLHRSKPPPQVHYKRNMPDIDSLLDVWPEEFEQALKTLKLPSPDLDLSLAEYSKTLCGILDIPTYENPIESLHQMFSLYMDFRDNPHFQAREQSDREPGMGYGSADVMRVDQGF